MKKTKRDLIYNLIAMAIMAASGLAMNTIVAFYYNTSVLGVFNEAYAWYMILSQFSVFGIHMAVLKMVPEQSEAIRQKTILWTAMVTAGVVAIGVTAVSEGIVTLAKDFAWRQSLQFAVPGLFFFSENKVLLNYLNARYKLSHYAFFQSLRYILLVVILLIMSVMGVDPELLIATFPISEAILMLTLLIYLVIIKELKIDFSIEDARGIMGFGTRIFPSNLVLEMNTKVDIVCLGFLLRDSAQIGVYSFAILFSDGFYQIYVTIRKLINPGLATANSQGKLKEYIKKTNTEIRKYDVWGTLSILGLVVVVYYGTCLLIKGDEYVVGLVYMTIICVAIAMNNKSIIYGDILGQTGYPLDESRINILTVLSNFVFNIILIIMMGTVGAAIATAFTHFIFAFMQKKILIRRTGISY